MDHIASQWQPVELSFHTEQSYDNAYTRVEMWAEFRHDSGRVIRRPGFWDGGSTFRIRFVSPEIDGRWSYRTFCTPDDSGLTAQTGTITISPGRPRTRYERHGLLKMSPGRRSVVHHDQTPFLVVGDTAWALPWRATLDECEIYARDRQRKGFNATLLMTVQPDMHATGPRSRTEDHGFDIGFEDLAEGHINRLRPEYFQYFDKLVHTLVHHGITPVYQPVFHGYGWKGRNVAGRHISGDEYARYCRYLVARFGAWPAIYLIGGDGLGTEVGVDPGGCEVHEWDAYEQPTGIHYGPQAPNNAHQDRDWLDFQWCQTGHGGEHIESRVADMWRNQPTKAVANGEPTYENIGEPGRAAGWWQGHEAWCNLTSGGTMGVVYGAGSLWQWMRHKDEPDHQPWCKAQNAGWREALDFEGSNYVGVISQILDGLPLADMQPNWAATYACRGLAVPGKLFIRYMSQGGGSFPIIVPTVPRHYRVVDPRTGRTLQTGQLPDTAGERVAQVAPSREPRVIIFTETPAGDAYKATPQTEARSRETLR
jgi:hypothetical protein